MPVVEAGAATLARLLARATRALGRAGAADPRREAVAIWAALVGTSPAQVWLARAEPQPTALRRRFEDSVARRAAGEPLAYVVGSAGFRTLELAVDARVLIPRPETEGLVERVLDWVARRRRAGHAVERALDVGTGSGAIALSLAVEGPFREVVAVDASASALAVADQNVRRVAPGRPVRLVRGSLVAPFGEARFDVVVSNPPYVTEMEWLRLDPGVRDYEPRGALVGGPDGLGPTRALLVGAGRSLRHGGLLALELDCGRAGEVVGLARAAGWRAAGVDADVFQRPRYLLASRET